MIIMKNRLKISVLLAGFAFVGSLFATTSCKQYENYDTQQISGSKTSLNVYGPRPAMRGAKMTFIGAHMDKVTAIEFPVHGDVTDITVVSEREINVIVPEDAGEIGRFVQVKITGCNTWALKGETEK